MALRSLPIQRDPRPGTDDDQYVTYYCAAHGGYYPAAHFTDECHQGGDA